MRTLMVTMLVAGGLLCIAPGAGAVRDYGLTVTGQASHLRPVTGDTEIVRWTVTNTGDRHIDHVHLETTVPAGWVVKNGPGCAHAGADLRCDLGELGFGRHASVDIPMVVHRPLGTVQLRAWTGGTVGRMNIPGRETSFQVVVLPRKQASAPDRSRQQLDTASGAAPRGHIRLGGRPASPTSRS